MVFSMVKYIFFVTGTGLYTLPCFDPEITSASPDPLYRPHVLQTDTSILQLGSTGLLYHQAARISSPCFTAEATHGFHPLNYCFRSWWPLCAVWVCLFVGL